MYSNGKGFGPLKFKLMGSIPDSCMHIEKYG